LGMLIEKACGMSLSEYASEKLWKPLQAMHDASWSLDKKDGTEKAYCCIYSNARDFARLGSLYLHDGNWKGKQIVSAKYINESLSPVALKMPDGSTNDCYGYGWWLLPDYKGHRVFYARGIQGQYIAVIPDTKTIVVRLGNKRGEKTGNHCNDLFVYLDGALEMIGNGIANSSIAQN
jgi:CubicO group peptidase (beta-lactamase class C family)